MPVELDELVWHLCLKLAVRVVGGEAASNEPKQPCLVSLSCICVKFVLRTL